MLRWAAPVQLAWPLAKRYEAASDRAKAAVAQW
jgi:hypothetical protein